MRWDDFRTACPEIAVMAQDRFARDELVMLGTLRADGSPRVTPCEIDLAEGMLVLGMMWRSMKALDLLRDPRIALHGPTVDPPEDDPGAWEGEAKLAGRAVEVSTPRGGHEFRIDIDEVVLVRVGVPPDHIVIEAWHPGRGMQRWQRR